MLRPQRQPSPVGAASSSSRSTSMHCVRCVSSTTTLSRLVSVPSAAFRGEIHCQLLYQQHSRQHLHKSNVLCAICNLQEPSTDPSSSLPSTICGNCGSGSSACPARLRTEATAQLAVVCRGMVGAGQQQRGASEGSSQPTSTPQQAPEEHHSPAKSRVSKQVVCKAGGRASQHCQRRLSRSLRDAPQSDFVSPLSGLHHSLHSNAWWAQL